MTTAWGAFFTDYEGIAFRQYVGWLLVGVISTQVPALIMLVLWHRHRGMPGSRRARKFGRTRILGLLGGLITVIGVFVLWATGRAQWPVFVFGILALEFIAIPTDRAATVGLGWGILALLYTLYVIPAAVRENVTFLGCLILLVGCALVLTKSRMIETTTEALPAEAPHQTDNEASSWPRETEREGK